MDASELIAEDGWGGLASPIFASRGMAASQSGYNK
jgi:hypothetical protein